MTTDTHLFADTLRQALPFAPTRQQDQLADALSRWLTVTPPDSIFMLNGYAGTGKTSMVGALVRTLEGFGVNTVLMAPTGRAAKVFSAMAGRPAYTIHRRIYRIPGAGTPGAYFTPTMNTRPATVFIVDEASMISDEATEMTGTSLLDDLVQYCFSADGCRLLLVGDTAQLPPVGADTSPALDPETMRRYGLRLSRATLTATVRQPRGSGILLNATDLRRLMTSTKPEDLPAPRLTFRGFDDVTRLDGFDLVDELSNAYHRDGRDETIVITRSNRAATAANLAIRSQVFYSEEELVRGERLMCAKNNYAVTRQVRGIDFIANGEMLTVREAHSTEYRFGLRFANVTLALSDREDAPEFDAIINLDSLTSNSAALDPALWNEFFRLTLESLPADLTQAERARALRTDPWLNALQVKYAYAVTCHKAQGGQWANVFVDGSALQPVPGTSPLDLYRWVYTAVTRATTRLYVVGLPEE